ncbi:hypothetical protein AURDEDRAFT_122762 [Auricularia subglabra TFB-10046 SS5]|nr:hypothetical protein AURDEDRAFT_122762 [Auricularia subglabra TFB-10046 SS5]
MALALFFLGVLELLWRLNPAVAVPVTAVAILIAIFYLATSILPAVHLVYWCLTHHLVSAQCPYKSPQAWLLVRATLALVSAVQPTIPRRALGVPTMAKSWMAFDLGWTAISDDALAYSRPEYRFKALGWLRQNVDHADLPTWIWHCLHAFVLGSQSEFVRRSPSANVRSCLLLRNLEAPALSQLDGNLQAWCMLSSYALDANMSMMTQLELLWKLAAHLPSNLRGDSRMISWFTVTKRTIESQNDQTFPTDICELLLSSAVKLMQHIAEVDYTFECLLLGVSAVIFRCEPSDRQAGYIWRLRRLDVYWQILHDGPFGASMFAPPPTADQEDPALQSGSATVVLAQFGRSIRETLRGLVPEFDPEARWG